MNEPKYKTVQRKELLKFISENNKKYVSAEEILEYLKEKNINIGQTTIYRFLNSLEKQGKVRVELKEHTKYYQYISESCNKHYHLKCEDCGKIIHFECEELEEFNKHISKEHKFKIDNNAVIYGHCERCLSKKNNRRK